MKWRHAVIVVGLVAVTWLVFWPVHSFEFVNFDDEYYVTDNPSVRGGLSFESFTWAFTQGHKLDGNWVPLTWLSLILDAEIYDMRSGGFHLTNLLLHTLNVVILYFVLHSMTEAPAKSAFVAVLFAIHPLHVESVAWVVERKDVLSTLFGFLAIAGYVRYARQPERNEPGRAWYLLALLAYLASLMSKQMLVTLPFALLLLDYWPLGRLARRAQPQNGPAPLEATVVPRFPPQSLRRLVLEKVPFLLLTIAFSAIAFVAQRQAGSVSTLEARPLQARLANVVVAYVAYLRDTFWPDNLAVFYPYPEAGIPSIEVASAACLLLLVSVVAIWQARQRPYLLVGWLWYLGTLVPVIGLVQVGDQQFADRYTYIPLIGVFVAVAWLVDELGSNTAWSRAVAATAGIAVVAALAVCARWQVDVWQNSVTLFEHALAVTRPSTVAHHSLGAAYEAAGRPEDAIAQYRHSLAITPTYAPSHFNLANALSALKDYEQAVVHYRQAIAHDANYADAHNNLGNALRALRRTDDAMFHFREAVRINPQHGAAHGNLASLLYPRGDVAEALRHFHQAVLAAPDSAAAHANLATALRDQGQLGAALEHFRRALALDAGNDVAREGLVLTYVQLGRAAIASRNLNDALAYLRHALELDPDAWLARYNLAAVLQLQNQLQAAESELKRVLVLNPDLAEAHNDLGVLLLRRGQTTAAIEHFREALRINPDFAAAKANLERASP